MIKLLVPPRRRFFFYLYAKMQALRNKAVAKASEPQPQPPGLLDELPALQTQPMTKEQDFKLRSQREAVFSHLEGTRLKKADQTLGTNTYFFTFDNARFKRIDSHHVLQKHLYITPTEREVDPKEDPNRLKNLLSRWRLASKIKKMRVTPRYKGSSISSNQEELAVEVAGSQRAYLHLSFPRWDLSLQSLQSQVGGESGQRVRGSQGVFELGELGVTQEGQLVFGWDQFRNILTINDQIPEINSYLARLNAKDLPYVLHSFRLSPDSRHLVLLVPLDFDSLFGVIAKDLASNTLARRVFLLRAGRLPQLQVAGNKLYFVNQNTLCRVNLDQVEAQRVQVLAREGLSLAVQPGSQTVLCEVQGQKGCQLLLVEDGRVQVLNKTRHRSISKMSQVGLFFTQLDVSWNGRQFGSKLNLLRRKGALAKQGQKNALVGLQLQEEGEAVLVLEPHQRISDILAVKGFLCVLIHTEGGVKVGSLSLKSWSWKFYGLGFKQCFFSESQTLVNQTVHLEAFHYFCRASLELNLWSQALTPQVTHFAAKSMGRTETAFFTESTRVDLNSAWLQTSRVATADGNQLQFELIYAKSIRKDDARVIIVLLDQTPAYDPVLFHNVLDKDFVLVVPKHRGSFASPQRFEQGAKQRKIASFIDIIDLVVHLRESKLFKSVSLLGLGQVSAVDAMTTGAKLGNLLDSLVCINGLVDPISDLLSQTYGGPELHPFVKQYSPFYQQGLLLPQSTFILARSLTLQALQAKQLMLKLRKKQQVELYYDEGRSTEQLLYKGFAFVIDRVLGKHQI